MKQIYKKERKKYGYFFKDDDKENFKMELTSKLINPIKREMIITIFLNKQTSN